MHKKRVASHSLVTIAILTISCLLTATVHAQQPLVIGAVSGKPDKHIKFSQPLANYLTERVYPSGGTIGKVKIAASLDELIAWFNTGQIDVTTETVFAALKIQQQADAEIVARRWKKGVAQYQSIFITHNESGIRTLDDLKGRKLLFEDKSSTSGFFLPASILIKRGMRLQFLQNFQQAVKEDHIGVLFASGQLNTSSELNMTAWVYQKRVDAGAFSSLDWANPKHAPPAMKKMLHYFAESQPFPRSLMLVRSTLPEEIKTRIQSALFEADQSDKGKNALRTYQKTKKFDALDQVTLTAIDEARELLKIVETHL